MWLVRTEVSTCSHPLGESKYDHLLFWKSTHRPSLQQSTSSNLSPSCTLLELMAYKRSYHRESKLPLIIFSEVRSMPKCAHKQSMKSVVWINRVVHESSQQQTKIICDLNKKIRIESILDIFYTCCPLEDCSFQVVLSEGRVWFITITFISVFVQNPSIHGARLASLHSAVQSSLRHGRHLIWRSVRLVSVTWGSLCKSFSSLGRFLTLFITVFSKYQITVVVKISKTPKRLLLFVFCGVVHRLDLFARH